MAKRNQDSRPSTEDDSELRNRLQEAEETLRAVRQYMVDAFVVNSADGIQVVTLNDAEFPYRLMVESMNEGAVTLIPDGTIFYCNPRFSEMVKRDPKKLIGVQFQDLLPEDQQQQFDFMLRDAGRNGLRGEFCLYAGKDDCVPVQLSFYQLRADDANGVAIIATDITERIQSEKKIRKLAAELTIAEQEERHRISQVLHDDLQQRLFAIRAQLSSITETLDPGAITTDMQVSLNQVQGWLAETITITRNLSVDISPSVLSGEGIVEAVNWLSSRMKEQHGLEVQLHSQGDFHYLPDHLRVTVFQAVRELLFNVVKHSGVLQVKVEMERSDGMGCVIISDLGHGFDTETILGDPHTAHGLMVVGDRLNLLGGSMHIESKPGKGTLIKILFPI